MDDIKCCEIENKEQDGKEEDLWNELMGNDNDLEDEVNDTLHDKSKASGTDVMLNTLSEYLPKEQSLNKTLKLVFSIVLLCILGGLTITLILMVAFLGMGKLKLNETTFRLIITGIFLEIIGIVKIMVVSIFPQDDKKLLYDFIKNCSNNK